MSAYSNLEQHYRRMGRLEEAVEMLHWDQATMMPDGGAAARAEQVATIRVIHHELATDPRLPDWFAGAEEEALGDWQAANLREMRRGHAHATAVPADLVAAHTRAASASEMVWRVARKDNDFARLAPELERLLEIVRAIGAAKGEALGKSPYDALLDEYEPGGSTARVDTLFGALSSFLPELIDRVIEHQASRPTPELPPGPFSQEAQRAVGVQVMEAIGFDFQRGRLDVSHHPFCGGTPDDVRITTRYRTDDFTKSLMGVIHETGHAMYELGLPAEWRSLPVGRARGMSVHESQSLLM